MTKDDQTVPGNMPDTDNDKAHTELRPAKGAPDTDAARSNPRPRSKVIPKDLDDDDDLFNDMPV